MKQTELRSSASHALPGTLTAVELTAGAAPTPGFISDDHASRVTLKPLDPIHAGHVLPAPPLQLHQSQLSSHSLLLLHRPIQRWLFNVQLRLSANSAVCGACQPIAEPEAPATLTAPAHSTWRKETQVTWTLESSGLRWLSMGANSWRIG